MKEQKTLKGLAEIKQFFKSNETPIYFISATCFNLLGIDEWVGNLKYISHIDSFEGLHPNLFSPKVEMAHEEFQSIEDINNYLLQHTEVIDYIESRSLDGKAGKALFLMFNEKTEEAAKTLGLDVCFPSAKLRTFLDNIVNTNRLDEKAGVACVPYVLSSVESYSQLRKVSEKLGKNLVVQTPFGDSGHTTFFISNEQEFDLHKEEIIKEKEVKIMKRINCYGTAIEGCVTKHGTLVAPLMTELVGFKELTPYKGGWCGNEVYANAFTPDIREKATKYTQLFGDQLRKEGYKGYFELDFLIDQDNGEIYLGELNPRISGASSITNHALFAMKDVPLFLFHLLEWMDVPYEIDVKELTDRWAKPENNDSWSQLIIKHTKKTLAIVTEAPASGIWEMKKNGKIKFKKMDAHRQSVVDDNEAFFFQITQKNGYLYEGADLGILVMRGRLMSDDFKLSDRGKRWIRALRAQYKSDIIDAGLLTEEDLMEAGDFKML
ncbi:MAG: biotin carboxylase [Bacteroidetes bacterium]|nr:biotin carboxylase [Bacteroidota bacterium]